MHYGRRPRTCIERQLSQLYSPLNLIGLQTRGRSLIGQIWLEGHLALGHIPKLSRNQSEWCISSENIDMSLTLSNSHFHVSGIVMHELMHAAGFWHEQSRADRDDHITINWANIQTGMEFNFLKYDLRKIDHLGAKYDTCSVMHYGAYAFAKVSKWRCGGGQNVTKSQFNKFMLCSRTAGDPQLLPRNQLNASLVREMDFQTQTSGRATL